MHPIIQLCRPKQWIKNLFIFIPLFFDKKIFDPSLLSINFIVFIAFSLIASAIYCFNDIYDADIDRLHPEKKFRPIASGAVSKKSGIVLMTILVCFSLVASSFVRLLPITSSSTFLIPSILILYFLMNIAYSTILKKFPLVDVFVIAIGFVLRVIIGSIGGDIYLSHWIILMTFLLALFLAFAKRRDDVVNYEIHGVTLRKGIHRYNLKFMDQSLSMIATITIVCYIMYTVSPEVISRLKTDKLYLTSIFVLAGILRYLQLTIVDTRSGNPTRILLSDKFIQASIILWGCAFLGILYV